MKIILHIGLHKTATKFFQHNLFPKLDKEKFLYNPPSLDQLLIDYLKAEEIDKIKVLDFLKKETNSIIQKYPKKTILLSREAMSGNLFSAYKYWEETTRLLKIAFPEAKIIIFLRNQVDWLISCYRESIHEHHYQRAESFFCYDEKLKKFLNPKSSKNANGYANLNPLRLDYSEMLQYLFSLFGRESVNVFFFENFKNNSNLVVRKILDIVGSEHFDPKEFKGIPNRGYSAQAIEFSILRAEFLKKNGLTHKLHRPIYFFGKDSIPAGNISLSILEKKKYWGNNFLRDNEEVRSPNYPELSIEEKKDFEKSWRHIVKNLIDRADYIDWDFLGEMRPLLESHYKDLNQKLLRLFEPSDIPNVYFK